MNLSVKVIAFPLELRIIFNDELHKEIAVRPTTWASWSTVSKSHLSAGVDTRRNIQGERLGCGHSPIAPTSLARAGNDFAGRLTPHARRGGDHLPEQALADSSNFTRPTTFIAALWSRSDSCARSLAVIAVHRKRDLEGALYAEAGFAQRNANSDLGILAKLRSSSDSTCTCTHAAKEGFKDVAESRVEPATLSAATS
jgi:hypothetical protein